MIWNKHVWFKTLHFVVLLLLVNWFLVLGAFFSSWWPKLGASICTSSIVLFLCLEPVAFCSFSYPSACLPFSVMTVGFPQWLFICWVPIWAPLYLHFSGAVLPTFSRFLTSLSLINRIYLSIAWRLEVISVIHKRRNTTNKQSNIFKPAICQRNAHENTKDKVSQKIKWIGAPREGEKHCICTHSQRLGRWLPPLRKAFWGLVSQDLKVSTDEQNSCSVVRAA